MRVLVVGDDEKATAALTDAAHELGHTCLAVSGVDAAWEELRAERPDVVVCERSLADGDGFELCRRIRGCGNGQGIHVILLVGGDWSEIAEAFAAGADDCLAYPLDPADVWVRLLAAERSRSTRERLAQTSEGLEAARAELGRVARTDGLTGLGNRLRLDEDLAALHARAMREGHPYAVAMVDVDHFKPYNDHYGHPAGDEVLRTVASAVSGSCRAGDRAYRYGGEEIAVLYHRADRAAAKRAAERLRLAVRRRRIRHQARPDGIGILTVSAGVAGFRPGVHTGPEQVLAAADAALYEAKRAGRDRVVAAGEEAASPPSRP